MADIDQTDDLDNGTIATPLSNPYEKIKCSFTAKDLKNPVLTKRLIYENPDQYFRRIRDVRVEIIAPDYRGHYLNAQLSLTENFLDLKGIGDKVGNRIGSQTMATSTAHQESGKFDFHFGSDKFLPFEGAGAVDSKWSLEITGFENTRNNDEGTSKVVGFFRQEKPVS